MKRKAKWTTAVIVLAAAALTVFLYIQGTPPEHSASDENGPNAGEIRFQATKENMTRSVEVKGKSSYVKETTVYAPFTAEVMKWHVDEGQSLKAGDTLFELDAGKLQNELSLAEARILQQQLDLRMLDVNALTDDVQQQSPEDAAPAFKKFARKEQDELQKQLKRIELDIAQADVKDKRERLTGKIFTAPETGIFLFTGQKQPEKVEQDKPVGKIVDISELQLICEVSEFEVFRIKENLEVDVRIDALQNEKIKGRVLKVAKFAKAQSDQSSGSARFEVTIALDPHPGMIAGLSLTGKIITDSRQNALVVPTIAVLREGDQYFVYSESKAGVVKRPIRIGLETADKTEVLEGLSDGDTVVLR